ncbi:DUF4145 domain-containing protein [Bifidobacterium samirii]|nr:DUF4145 domain-containing protein [Bifidobacterium samirii]
MTRVKDSYKTDKGGAWVAFCTCDYCGYPNIAMADESALATYRVTIGTVSANWFVDANGEDSEKLIHWLPEEPLGREFKDVPQHISDAASEAYACFSIRSYRAAILMARSVLEACAKDKGVTKGNLASKIDALADDGVISPQIQAEAHEIRYLGNDMAHGDFVEPVGMDDADDVLGFLATFLDYVYQMPAAIRRRQEARKQRGANPNA